MRKVTIEKRFGARLRDLRMRQGWSQDQLSERTGIGRDHISRLENGKKEAGIAIVETLANAFRITVGEFMKGL